MRLVAYFARHGETSLNKENRFRGRLDVDLSAEGMAQAAGIGKHLANVQFSQVFVSPKKRARHTAAIALRGRKLDTQILPDLDSYDIGDLAGEPKNAENLETLKYYQQHPNEPCPGGESLIQFRKDVQPLIAMAIRKGDEAGAPTLTFAHSSTIHEVSNMLHRDHQAVKIRPGGIVAVFKTNAGGYIARPILKESKPHQDRDIGS